MPLPHPDKHRGTLHDGVVEMVKFSGCVRLDLGCNSAF